MKWQRKDILAIEDMSVEEIRHILHTAKVMKEILMRPIKKLPTLKGKSVVNVFYEASTRTRTSFEMAGKVLGADTTSIAVASSSVSKGESLYDTAKTIQAMRADLVIHGLAKGAALKDRVMRLLGRVGLREEHYNRYPHEFSGGQRQRIALARALVLEPTFIVLDEPTSALDMLIQSQMVDLLRDLQKKRDLTYMFISHDLRVVAALASRLLVLRNGKMVEEGTAADLFKNPKSDYTRALFAAAFNLETAPEGVVAQ